MARAWSDGASGLLIALFGILSLSKRTAWFGQWASCFAGLWLLFAPLVFWAPTAAVYSNDMLVGALVIAFSVLVPMMPGMSMAGMMDPRSEEHTSELQSLMRISYAVFCLKKKKIED